MAWRSRLLSEAIGLTMLTAKSRQARMRIDEWSATQSRLARYVASVHEMWRDERWGIGESLRHQEEMRIHNPRESMTQAETRLKRVVHDAIKHAPTATERMRFRSWLRELLGHFHHLQKLLLPQPIKHDPRQLALSI